jgi:hypothetical protein
VKIQKLPGDSSLAATKEPTVEHTVAVSEAWNRNLGTKWLEVIFPALKASHTDRILVMLQRKLNANPGAVVQGPAHVKEFSTKASTSSKAMDVTIPHCSERDLGSRSGLRRAAEGGQLVVHQAGHAQGERLE